MIFSRPHFMNVKAGLAVLISTGLACGCATRHSYLDASVRTQPLLNLVQYVNPLCGTSVAEGVIWGDNNCFPGAVAPFGMLQWSPDTERGEHPGGYLYSDGRISDFSLEHMSGAGCPYGEDFGFMPLPGPSPSSTPAARDAFASAFSHTNESATPGSYCVTLNNGLKIELTATTRSGFARFTYPDNDQATLMIKAGSGPDSQINGVYDSGAGYSSLSVSATDREIDGSAVGGRFCQYSGTRPVYFVAKFDQPFASWSAWSDKTLTPAATNVAGTASGVYLTFNVHRNRTVLVKVGISYVSIANARTNLEIENPASAFSSADFEFARKRANDDWNWWLNRIQVSGGSTNDEQTFYSMLYHALQDPSVCSDINGDYPGYDGRTHNAGSRCQYCMFSGWDIYRSEAQLLAMIAPGPASAMAESLIADCQQGGAFPRWGAIDQDTGIMIGDPAAPIIADFYAFGATDFDTTLALRDLFKAAFDPSVGAPRTKIRERDSLKDYLKLGYVPEHPDGGYGSVSMTLEYASADAALAQFSKALNDEADYKLLTHRAQNWRNLYNPATGYFQMRRRDGGWAPGFTNNTSDYDGDTAFVEGTAGQYLWMVPFNLSGLVNTMGGTDTAEQRLDEFFSKLNTGFNQSDSWMAWMGNEPCLVAPWIYCFLGTPYKTQALVRRTMKELYSAGPVGYGGNDDLGEMSSWYVFAALGMYPEIPGSDVLVLGSPLFPKTIVKQNNSEITILGNDAAEGSPYVKSLTVNGQKWNQPWIYFSDISHGGTLDYNLTSTPNMEWGTNTAAAPPSFGDTTSVTTSPH
jgi:predicted alpha-1,2-mannosidase